MSNETENLDSQLINAASDGQFDKVEYLLEQGADVNAQNKAGVTALMYAVYNGYLDIVQSLVEEEANVKWDISNIIAMAQESLRKKHPMTEGTKNFISEKSRIVSVVVEAIEVNKSTLKLLCSSEKSAKELVSTLYDVINYRIRIRKDGYPLWEKTPENNWVVENCLDILDVERDGSAVIITTEEYMFDWLRDAYVAMRAKLLENSPEELVK